MGKWFGEEGKGGSLCAMRMLPCGIDGFWGGTACFGAAVLTSWSFYNPIPGRGDKLLQKVSGLEHNSALNIKL